MSKGLSALTMTYLVHAEGTATNTSMATSANQHLPCRVSVTFPHLTLSKSYHHSTK
jgi:hypothetical protein